MKLSQLFGQTLRDTPAEAEVVSHPLLMRAGFFCSFACKSAKMP
jgi:prolyl-tRNA synthetase